MATPFLHAEIPTVGTVFSEVLTGKTVTAGRVGASGPIPQNTANANDRNHATVSGLPAGFAGGSISWFWAVDFGVGQLVNAMRVWEPSGTGQYFDNPSGVIIEWSNDNSAWTSAAYTYSTATVSTGLAYPAATTTTEYRYALTSPSTHRYWRLRQTAGGGLYSGRSLSEWYIDGATVDPAGVVWNSAPDTIDASIASSDDVTAEAVTETGGTFWRGDLGIEREIEDVDVTLGAENAGAFTVLVQGGDLSDYSDQSTVLTIVADATGSLTADELSVHFDGASHRYWSLVLDTTEQDLRVYEVAVAEPAEIVPTPAGRAILEIYVHDEDASRWGTATWATGPATGTEGIWSAAGWQDVTPEGVNAHIIWGSRRPSRGILADQNAASWNVETYDPDRILDPGNFDSPYYPQLVAGVPIRISHDSLVIRTGYVDEWHYKHKRPYYQGQILATDTWAMLNQAMVPADSVLGNTLYSRIADAIEAAGIAVGGIPLPPSGTGPTIADWVEGAPLDDPTSVGDHVRIAAAETLWMPFIAADAGLQLRAWGTPLDRGREISAPNLEDLESISSEDGLYSVVRVQVEDPDLDPIEREAAPLPRYGRRLWERREPTVDPEGYAAAILAERPWPGVQYVPGAIHCFTAEDVDYFGSLEIMERVTITLPGAVSVQGRILGGELFVEHRAQSTQGAKWIFNFAVATDGSTAIGLDTLVSDQAGDTLLDDATGTDYLEAD